MLGLVRQHRRAGDIADGVDARHIGLAVAIDHDGAAIGFHAELFEPEIFDIADHADGRDHAIDGDRLRAALAVVDGRGDAVGLLVELGDFRAGDDLDALLLELLAREGGDLRILDRQDLRQHFDDRHLGAHGAIEGREFDADGAGADHQQRLRHLVRVHRLEIGPDQFLVRLDAGQHARPRAGRDDDVLGLIAPGPSEPFGASVLEAFTVSLPGASILASPQITLTLFFFSRKPTPVFIRPATPRERLMTAAGIERHIARPTARNPWRAACSGRFPPSAAAPWSECSPSSSRCRRGNRARRRRS